MVIPPFDGGAYNRNIKVIVFRIDGTFDTYGPIMNPYSGFPSVLVDQTKGMLKV